jgi:hypothetical protein
MIGSLNTENPDLGILPVTDPSFSSYGAVHRKLRVDSLLGAMDRWITVTDGVVCEPDPAGMDRCPRETAPIVRTVFGGMEDLQLGWMHGRNSVLNSLEYHKCPEAVVAASDMVVFVGLAQDIVWPEGTYDISRVKAFFVPRGTLYEVLPCCLHGTPTHARRADGFRCAVMLPRGTRSPVDLPPSAEGEAALLHGRGTWLIAHPSEPSFQGTSVHFGLIGRSIQLRTQ